MHPHKWFDRFAPNQLTLAALFLVPPTMAFLLLGWMLTGLTLFAFGLVLDGLDGALARSQYERMTATERSRQRTRPWYVRRGITRPDGRPRLHNLVSGAHLDPLVDKLRYVGALLALGGWDRLPRGWIVAAIAIAILLTVLRFFRKAGGDANGFGKMKAVAEATLIFILMLSDLGLGMPALQILLLLGLIGTAGTLAWLGKFPVIAAGLLITTVPAGLMIHQGTSPEIPLLIAATLLGGLSLLRQILPPVRSAR